MEENYFTRWIKENYYPTSIVFSTEEAKRIIGKNNLSPSELLRPFGIFKEIKYYPNEKFGTTIKNFRMDFYDSYSCRKLNQSHLQLLTDNLLDSCPSAPNWNLQSAGLSKKYIEELSRILKNYSFPWFNEYEKMILEFTKFNEYEAYQQPLSFIYFCSVLDDPQTVIPNSKDKIPPLISEGVYEVNMPSLIIILQDLSEDKTKNLTRELKDTYIKQFQQKFREFYILYWDINNNDINTNFPEDIWKDFIHKIDIYGGLHKNYNAPHGTLISKEERSKYRDTLLGFMDQYVMKYISEKIREYDDEINATKKGLKNGIISLFKNKEKADYNQYFQMYKLAPLEKKELFFVIIQFYFRNYESAYEVLKIFISDVKSKSPFHNSAANELLAIISNLLPDYSKGSEFDDAYKLYLKQYQHVQGFRCLLLNIKYCEHRQLFQKLPRFLTKAINTEIPHSQNKTNEGKFLPHDKVISRLQPLILEKLSIYYLLYPSVYNRKFCLYIVLAGSSFKMEKGNFSKYALNAYGNIFRLLNEKNYSFVRFKEYLNNVMGDICKNNNYYEGGLKFFQNCVELSKYSSKKIDIQYGKMMECLQKCIDQNNGVIPDNIFTLSVPEIDNSSILVLDEQDYLISQIKESKPNWKNFSKYSIVPIKPVYLSLTPSDMTSLKNLDNIIENKQNFSNFFSKSNFKGNVNNKMYVRFTIVNPINLKFNITNMKLICDFTPELVDIEEEKKEETKYLEYQEISFDLDKQEQRTVELYCKILVPGHCVMKGVEIVLDNIGAIQTFFNTKNLSNLEFFLSNFVD